MKGHEKLVSMRFAGKKPSMVFVNDMPCETNWFETGLHVTISIHLDDIRKLDMRFLKGVAVSAHASTKKRAVELFEAIKAIEPKRLGCGWVGEKKPWSSEEPESWTGLMTDSGECVIIEKGAEHV